MKLFNQIQAQLIRYPGIKPKKLEEKLIQFRNEIHEKKEEIPIHHQLYHLLEKTTPAAYSQYNALKRRLVSFCRAAENA